jgi:hypothetical protein
LLPLALLVLAAGAFLVYFLSASASTTQSRAQDAALTYARTEMIWAAGPTVQSVHVIPIHRLETTLRATVPSSVRQDVNVQDLQRRYGPNKQIALVVLSGVYNSLAPDEGVEVHGDVVVLVDPQTDRVMLVMD